MSALQEAAASLIRASARIKELADAPFPSAENFFDAEREADRQIAIRLAVANLELARVNFESHIPADSERSDG